MKYKLIIDKDADEEIIAAVGKSCLRAVLFVRISPNSNGNKQHH